MGLGAALIMPSTLSIITNVFPREERGRAIGVWSGVGGIGFGLGPLVGGALLSHFWWGSAFLINISLVVIALIGGKAFVPDSRDPGPRPLDLIGSALSIPAVAALIFGVTEALLPRLGGPPWCWPFSARRWASGPPSSGGSCTPVIRCWT